MQHSSSRNKYIFERVNELNQWSESIVRLLLPTTFITYYSRPLPPQKINVYNLKYGTNTLLYKYIGSKRSGAKLCTYTDVPVPTLIATHSYCSYNRSKQQLQINVELLQQGGSHLGYSALSPINKIHVKHWFRFWGRHLSRGLKLDHAIGWTCLGQELPLLKRGQEAHLHTVVTFLTRLVGGAAQWAVTDYSKKKKHSVL